MNNLVATKDEVSKMKERTSSTIKNINDLQDLEKTLYSSIENSASSPSPPSLQEQEQAIRRINELSKMRGTLFGSLQDSYMMNQYQVAQTRNDLVDELTSVKVIEGELNNSKHQMNALKQEKINKLRMVEINTYYGKRYESHTDLMKIIIITCVPILLITILSKKNIIPQNIVNIILAVIVVIFIVIIWNRTRDILFRDNMDYDQYEFPFDPQNVDLDSGDPSNIVYLPQELDMGIQCVGDACCTGTNMVYDKTNNVCTLQNNKTKTSDASDDTAAMTKEAFSSWNSTIKLQKNKNIIPFNDNDSNYVNF